MSRFSVEVNRFDVKDINIPGALVDIKSLFLSELFRVVNTSKTKYLSGPRPVKLDKVTGNLRASVKAAVIKSGDTLTGKLGIGNSAWYGKLHEEGIGGQKRRPFLEPAIDDHINDIQNKVLKAIDKALEDQIN